MENGFVVNGYFFVAGFKEKMFGDLTDEDKQKLDDILKKASNQYKDDMFAPLSGTWMYGPFAPKYGIWIPAFSFQAPFKTQESAKESSNQLLEEFNMFSKSPVCIAIAGGEIDVNYKELQRSNGTAYYNSGRYIDNINNCADMIKNKIPVKIIK